MKPYSVRQLVASAGTGYQAIRERSDSRYDDDVAWPEVEAALEPLMDYMITSQETLGAVMKWLQKRDSRLGSALMDGIAEAAWRVLEQGGAKRLVRPYGHAASEKQWRTEDRTAGELQKLEEWLDEHSPCSRLGGCII
jgi:hypothetical protein